MATTLLGGLLAAGMFFAPSVQAQGGEIPSIDEIEKRGIIFTSVSNDCRDNGNCELDDVLQVFVNISSFILGISGSVVLLMFVYGGFMWITAGGNEARIKKGKDVLVGTVIGLLIIFGAYTAINVVISTLKTGELPVANQGIDDTIGDTSKGIITSPDGDSASTSP